jgi:hypothetical protein
LPNRPRRWWENEYVILERGVKGKKPLAPSPKLDYQMKSKLIEVFRNYIELLMHKNTISSDNTEINLILQIKELETNPLFHDLVTETRHTFSGFLPKEGRGDLINDIYKGEWEYRIKNFFRRSNIYYDVYLKNNIDIDLVFDKYIEAFQRTEINEYYLAPLDYVSFAENCMDFGQFKIKKFTIKELNEIFQNRINKIFYTNAFIDAEQIEEYWFLCFSKSIPAPEIGLIHLEDAEGMDVCHVDIEYANYPAEILPFLKSLSLFDWGSDWLKEYKRQIKDIEVGWLRFNIPLVFIINDNLLDSPNHAPNLSLLKKVQYYDEDGEDICFSRLLYIDLDNAKTRKFKEFIDNTHRLLLSVKTEENNWQFFDIAINSFLKAFFSNGIEQILWYMISIEALLGQVEKSTENIANRMSRILGRTNEEKKTIKKKFKGEKGLYDFRCKLVHGKTFKEKAYVSHLLEARSLSRRIILWFIHYLSRIQGQVVQHKDFEKIPTRDDILLLIDLDLNDRNRMKRLLINLPEAFPFMEEWIT